MSFSSSNPSPAPADRRSRRHPLLPALALAALLLGLLAAVPAAADEPPGQRLVFLGDSLTAGYGLAPEQAYTAHIEAKIADAGWAYDVVNAGVSGDTTAGGLRRVNWILRKPADVVVIALGGNDGLRGLPIDDTRANLAGIIDRLRAKNPDVRILLAGMLVHPNMGQTYADAFQAIYPAIAREKDVALMPFMLTGVAGDPDLNQNDGIHPNVEGQRLLADNVWKHLRPLLAPADAEPPPAPDTDTPAPAADPQPAPAPPIQPLPTQTDPPPAATPGAPGAPADPAPAPNTPPTKPDPAH